MRSKFDQNAFAGFSAKTVEIPADAKSARMMSGNDDQRGRIEESLRARIAHNMNANSTIIRNAKFFPVIKGKKNGFAIIRGMNGMRQRRTMRDFRNMESRFIKSIVPLLCPSLLPPVREAHI